MAGEHLEKLRYNVFLIPAAIGPAIIFAILWQVTNLSIPYIGEGFRGSEVGFAAALCCWVWLILKLWRGEQASGVPSLSAVAKWVAIQLAVACGSIFSGRILFSIIPPFRNDWGAILGLLVGSLISNAALSPSRKKFEVQRGTVLLTDIEWQRRKALLKKTDEPEIKWAVVVKFEF
jgi:hypothetical protein